MKIWIGPLLMVLLAAVGCKPAPTPPEERSFDVRGIVRGFNFAADQLIVEHEDIPGFMDAMTMPFNVREGLHEVHRSFEIGDGIAFRFVVGETESWIESIEPIPAETVELPEAAPRRAQSADYLREGDQLPDFELVSQDGERIGSSAFKGKPLVITFIFTRCPVPDFCPLMSSNFAQLQQLIRERLNGSARLLSVTIDPEFDTPQVLEAYSRRYDRDPALWTFATGGAEAIAKLTDAFRVYIKPEDNTLAHGLATALVDSEGTIRTIWRGNQWTAAEVFTELEKLRPAAKVASLAK